jgi:hypothetical protein
MAYEATKINSLVIRVAGLYKVDANDIGHEVATKISDGLPNFIKSNSLGALNIRLTIPPKTNRESMAGIIANAIFKGIL